MALLYLSQMLGLAVANPFFVVFASVVAIKARRYYQ